MRLSKEEQDLLKNTLLELDDDAQLFLFGSRANDKKKGGDIDLLIISRKLNRRTIRPLRHKFFEMFGEQKIDIIIDNGEFNDPFVKEIFENAVQL